jgi:hypothetical protein
VRIQPQLNVVFPYLRDHSIDNWQSALRKQYFRRNPDTNPLGPEPPVPSRLQSPDSATPTDDRDDGEEDLKVFRKSLEAIDAPEAINAHDSAAEATDTSSAPPTKSIEEGASDDAALIPSKQDTESAPETKQEGLAEPPVAESKNWLDLSMLERLDSLHLLTEWQFQNPQRLRNIMKDDGDHGLWVRTRIVFIPVLS